LSPPHVVPCVSLSVQKPTLQNFPLWQSLSMVHSAPHTVPEQVNGPQSFFTRAGQFPVPLHVACTVATPLVHSGWRQMVLGPG
jgi:hypothetical protein